MVTPNSNPEDCLDREIELKLYNHLSLDQEYISQVCLLITRFHETGYLTYIINYQDIPEDIQKIVIHDFDTFQNAARRVIKFMLFTYDKDYVEEYKRKYGIEEFEDFERAVPYIAIRIKNYNYDLSIQDVSDTIPIRASKSAKLNKLSAIRAVVVGTTSPEPSIVKTIMKCVGCDYQAPISFYEMDKLNNIGKCPKCKGRLDMDETEVNDVQYIMLQDLNDATSFETSSPVTLRAIVNEDLTHKVQIGDSVVVTGVMRLDVDNESSKRSWKDKTKNSVDYYRSMQNFTSKVGGLFFPRLLEVNYIEVNNIDDYSNFQSRMHEIEELKKRPDLYDLLIRSFCPEVKGHENVKEGILLGLLGGVGKFNSTIDKRGNLRVMIIADPSIAKSVLLKYAAKIMKRGWYASASGSTAVGLTAATIRDEQTGQYTIAAGAILRCNGGVLTIDEISKLPPEAIVALYEVAEQETYTLSKAGILKTWNVDLVLIVAGNPKGGRYDPNISVHDNLNEHSAPFLTRFDLKYVMRDLPNSEKDRGIAKWVMDQYNDDFAKHTKDLIPFDLLASYIGYVRSCGTQPKMNDEAKRIFEDFYDETRQKFNPDDPESANQIVVREFEGVIRIAQARARAVFSEVIDAQIANYAIKLHGSMLVDIAPSDNDPKVADVNKIYNKSMNQVQKNNLVMSILKEMSQQQGKKRLDRDVVVLKLLEKGMSNNAIEITFKSLSDEIMSDENYITLM